MNPRGSTLNQNRNSDVGKNQGQLAITKRAHFKD